MSVTGVATRLRNWRWKTAAWSLRDSGATVAGALHSLFPLSARLRGLCEGHSFGTYCRAVAVSGTYLLTSQRGPVRVLDLVSRSAFCKKRRFVVGLCGAFCFVLSCLVLFLVCVCV